MLSSTLADIRHWARARLSQRRLRHTEGVAAVCCELAGRYGADVAEAEAVAWLHDSLRDLSDAALLKTASEFGIFIDDISRVRPMLLHGPVAAAAASRDLDLPGHMRRAVAWHTTGCRTMDVLAKCLFVADAVEPGRGYMGVEGLRTAAYSDLETAVLAVLDQSIRFVVARGELLHCRTVEARNALLLR